MGMEPTVPHRRRFRIVVAVDSSEYAEIVLEHAIDQAARHTSPDLHFVAVVPDESAAEAARAELALAVLQSLETLGTRGADWRSWLHVLVGDAGEEIAGFAGDMRADLIVIGRFGTHSKKGSTADRVLEGATCPALVVNLKQDVVEQQCPACVAVREQTDAESLFCPEHTSDTPLYVSRLAGWSSSTRGGSVW